MTRRQRRRTQVARQIAALEAKVFAQSAEVEWLYSLLGDTVTVNQITDADHATIVALETLMDRMAVANIVSMPELGREFASAAALYWEMNMAGTARVLDTLAASTDI